jgi:hypothetical protein
MLNDILPELESYSLGQRFEMDYVNILGEI